MTLPETQPVARGAIYDLGYQGYDGPRLGRPAAIATLFWSSWRSAFGLGRSGRAKIVPWGLTVLALLPAAVAVGITALVGDAVQPFTYDNYLPQIAITLSLFVAAQAPELVGGDQRNHVLSLYFSHAIQRIDYAAAKLGALTAALLVLTVLPQLVIFAGKVLSATDVLSALGTEAPKLLQIVVSSLLYSLTLAVVGLAIAAFTPRRSFATGGIIAFFLVTAIVGQILTRMDSGEVSRYAQLIDVDRVLAGVTHALFGGPGIQVGGGGEGGGAAIPELAGMIYIGTLIAFLLVGIGVIVQRYRRVQA
jgi:ABC-2 type transport system permease protein